MADPQSQEQTARGALFSRTPLLYNFMGQKKKPDLKDEVEFLIHYERKKCASLLWFGAVFGFFGFAFAFMCGLAKYFDPMLSEFHKDFPSGNGYFPSTVSEMVHNPTEPAGKCFFAFEFIGAGFIFTSWYPFELRNVYIGDSMTLPFVKELSWTMFRQFVPPAGMMLVATVTTTPFAQATPIDYVCISIHLLGAVMLFAGYAAVEAIALGMVPDWLLAKMCANVELKVDLVSSGVVSGKELLVRRLCLLSILFWYSAFCLLQVVLLLPLTDFPSLGQLDQWGPVTYVNNITNTVQTQIVLHDTATGFLGWLKILSYLTEVFCGIALIGSFLAIWWFCEERKVDLKDELAKVM